MGNSEKMSEKFGITQSQYSKIETGETDPTKYLNKLSKIQSVILMMCSVVKFLEVWRRNS